MESITTLRKAGSSLIATVPKEIIALEGLTAGQHVKITVQLVKKSFFGAARGIGPFTAQDEKWMEGNHD
ncbi:MAG: AbrB/MazE/SpoVT family DNA-binding domain-containing protein [Candidatus Woesearchaeota archaeon]|jgi:hypothetical protein|nr:AbrB/MazE/SpoVT family DNA-binding domain-containing protein [Candidatus Woesearchaeota archaeon]MDP7182206.1 AbrB/MazE/SpoVT family DNA-binding domain-containing protein [Candidatus Woesearchaeota archaeon]MDP7199093.1 AbrB/MazE/SpoVT family DNA-binding domain-containing protein [Candidatus Woesearchaeota archaeon]MDP7467803.1 AbrB/MazE/SpoVT family DNA-binding domain-containing protein [Candidatus Woesearchaeota archaeon]MDP7647945.1 AbrB/MazE/SpoVT family DNA-binding domain-containing pro|tara:strand:- start:92 stop:298 length:207 start_codon:yes stop_codon:yes gene_type:complete